jgi:hypothetical protein
VGRTAWVEAARHYRRALEVLETDKESVERDRAQLDILSSLLQVLQSTKGWNHAECVAVSNKARALAEKHNNLPHLILQCYHRWAGVVSSGDMAAAIALADELLVLAKRGWKSRKTWTCIHYSG